MKVISVCPTFADVLHLSNVRRWNMVDTTRTQSVAEHSFNVTVIALAIVKMVSELEPDLYNRKLSNHTMLNILHTAIMHDSEESITGDIPTPYKRIVGSEVKVSNEVLGKYEDPLCAGIVKMADLLESKIFIEKYGVRSKRFTEIVKGIDMEMYRQRLKMDSDPNTSGQECSWNTIMCAVEETIKDSYPVEMVELS